MRGLVIEGSRAAASVRIHVSNGLLKVVQLAGALRLLNVRAKARHKVKTGG